MSVPCQNCEDTVACCKSLAHLAHLIKLRFFVWCAKCAKYFGFGTSVVDALKDGNMNAIFFDQHEWTNNMMEVLNKIIINDIFTLFKVSSNTHITNVLITEVLTDSPLLLIKENINCGNFMNKDRFNFFTRKINHKLLTDFPQTITVVDERFYGVTLFHIFS